MIRINNHIFFFFLIVYKNQFKMFFFFLNASKHHLFYNKNQHQNSQLKSQQTSVFLITLKAEMREHKVIQTDIRKAQWKTM